MDTSTMSNIYPSTILSSTTAVYSFSRWKRQNGLVQSPQGSPKRRYCSLPLHPWWYAHPDAASGVMLHPSGKKAAAYVLDGHRE